MNREKLLAYIDGLASNEELLKLCTIMRNAKDAEKLTITAVNAFVPTDAEDVSAEVKDDFAKIGAGAQNTLDEPTRQNTNPGWTACSRIGGDTEDAITAALPASITTLCKKIKRSEGQAKQLLQLLWDRSKVKYDGQEFWK